MYLFALLTLLVYATILTMIGVFGIRTARPTLVSLAFTLAVLTVFRQIIFLLGLDAPNPQTHFEPEEWTLIVMANLTLLAWVGLVAVGYIAFRDLAVAFSRILPSGPSLKQGAGALGIGAVAAIAVLFTIAGTGYLVMSQGGFASFVYASKVGKEFQGLFVFRVAASLGSILALVGFLHSLVRLPNGRTRLTPASYMFIAMIVVAMAANYSWGNRYDMALMFIVFGLAWHYYVKPLSIGKLALATIAIMTFLQILKNLRLTMVMSTVGRDYVASSNFWLDVSLSLHFVEYDAFMLAIRDAGVLFDFRNGADFVNGLLSWIPRFLYESKETYHIGGWFRRIYQPDMINGWPVTTIGAWYVNFGAIGVALGGIISGFVMRMFDVAFPNVRTDPWHAAVGIGLAFFMFEAGVNTGFPQLIVLLLIPLALASVFLRMSTRRKGLTVRTTVQQRSPSSR